MVEYVLKKEDALAAYHLSMTIEEDFKTIVTRTRMALETCGFGVVDEIDLAELSRARAIDRTPHLILEASSPLGRDTGLGPTTRHQLSCQVVLRSWSDEQVRVDFMSPGVMIDLVAETIHDVADDVRARVEKVRDALVPTPAIAWSGAAGPA